MKLGNALRYAKIGLREAMFTLRTNIFMIAAMSVFVIIYFPVITYNMLNSESLALLPNEAKLEIILPSISINSLLVSLFISIIASAMIEEDRFTRVFEYLMAYSLYTAGGFLLIKMLTAIVIGFVVAVPYAIVAYIILNMVISVSPLLLIWLILSLLISIASLTLLIVLVTLVLEPKHASIMRYAILIVAMMALYNYARQSKQALDISTLASKIVGPLYIVSLIGLAAFIILYYIYRDRIVELALRW
ncbi:MAG: hypothetical protein QXP97_01160 [Desulfurococcus sp.]|uniref:hypothetical protein n=1 Tax=Desulfurococcus sp. TaxID=51678 RepID=UPI003169E45F